MMLIGRELELFYSCEFYRIVNLILIPMKFIKLGGKLDAKVIEI